MGKGGKEGRERGETKRERVPSPQQTSKESFHEERLFSSQPWEKKLVMGKREEAKRKDKESKEETRKTKKKANSLGVFSTFFLF